MDLLLACLATLLFVGLKSTQQRNVAFDVYRWIIPTSVGMSFCEFYVIAFVATSGFDVLSVLALGLSAGVGSLSATLLHGRFLGGVNGKQTGGVSSGMLAQGVTEIRGRSSVPSDGGDRRGDQSEEGPSLVEKSNARIAEIGRAFDSGGPR